MSRTETVILTNMCMVYDGNKVLVQDKLDPKWRGATFPGGHVEKVYYYQEDGNWKYVLK